MRGDERKEKKEKKMWSWNPITAIPYIYSSKVYCPLSIEDLEPDPENGRVMHPMETNVLQSGHRRRVLRLTLHWQHLGSAAAAAAAVHRVDSDSEGFGD
ncbi:hypothetical protein C0Q70_05682 [Pomacea canaliculata]|uniref:Uncharacterized protein n=1 Tax=Pomacea canaliculata TaxID=400727 RepID=A0A2T7PLW5_POMCA|nr:hypothetical protein C0Q70_05682 [Pomacea canaliculata]